MKTFVKLLLLAASVALIFKGSQVLITALQKYPRRHYVSMESEEENCFTE